MRNIFVTVTAVLAFTISNAQEFDPELFKTQIATLYESAFKSFNAQKEGTVQEIPDGTQRYSSTILLSESKDSYITVDAEKSHTFVSFYEMKTLPLAEKKQEELITLVLEATKEKGLVRSKATDIYYHKYQEHMVAFPSENIDIMGRYPSFSLGIVKDSNPPIVEIKINEPLWK